MSGKIYNPRTTVSSWDRCFSLYVSTARSYHMANESENGKEVNCGPIWEREEFKKLRRLYISAMKATVKRTDFIPSRNIKHGNIKKSIGILMESIEIAKGPWEKRRTIDDLCSHHDKKR